MRPARTIGLMLTVLAMLCLGVVEALAQPGLRTETPAQQPQPEPSSAFQLGNYRLEGEVRAGVQFFIEEPTHSRSAKFEEYRSVPEGLFLEMLRLRLYRPDERYSVWLEGSKWGREDQEYTLGAGGLGRWQFQFDWDQTPHVYSRGTARMLATEISPGVFVVPKPRPILPLYNTGSTIDEVGVRWDTARVSFFLTPTPQWELKAEYTRIFKEGTRALAMSFQTPMNNFAEYLEPINQTMHDFRIEGTYAEERWQLKFGYVFSMFENHRRSVTGDNPCYGLVAQLGAGGCNQGAFQDGTPGSPGNPLGEERGRVSLAPDNMAHTFTLGGGVNLPMRTRITANASYSLRLQNEPFLAHSIIPYIVATSSSLVLPEDKSLNGVVGVFLGNLNVTSRPLKPLTLSFKYRIFDLHDMSDEPKFPGSVESDSRPFFDAGAAIAPVGTAREARRFSFTKQNAEADARWRFSPELATTLGVGWERWDRSHRNAHHTDEPYLKAVVDATPFDWLLARLTYRPSFRRDSNYDPYPTRIGMDQSPMMRKFDQAERDRQELSLLTQFSITDSLTASLTGGWKQDEYTNSRVGNMHLAALGLRESTDWSTGIDVTWSPSERVSVSGGYVHEWLFTKQRQQTNNPAGTPFNPSYIWISDNTDSIDTLYARAKVALIPRKLDLTFGWNYSYALGRIETRNPIEPTGNGAAADQNAKAKRFPAFEDELLRIDVGATYHFLKNWSATLGYAVETWRQSDFRTSTLNPFTPGISSIYLGEDLKNYTAHIVGLTLGYRFK